mgnify:CR=1 FL=1
MINKIKPNIWQFNFREFGSCVYLVKIKEHNILIDTGSIDNKDEFLEDLKKLNLKPKQIDIILLTHSHYDHNGNINLFKNAKLYTNSAPIKEIKVINSPGHTNDSICFLYEDVLFSGDVIFHNGHIGRTDFPESSPQLMQKSLEKLKKINYKILCPGHLV